MGAAHKIRLFNADVQEVSIAALKIRDDLLQSRAKTDAEIVRIYAERRRGKPSQPGTAFPPVLVFVIDGELWLADGFHRVKAAESLGMESVPAVVREGTMLDALLAGAEINMSKENLRGYQEDDRRRYAELLIRCGAGEPGKGSWDWGDTAIAERSGMTRSTIAKMRSELSVRAGIPIPDKVFAFYGGVKHKRPRMYKIKQGFHLKQKSGQESLRIGGRTEYAYGDSAENSLRERRDAFQDAKGSLRDSPHFQRWLYNRSVFCFAVPLATFHLGGMRIGYSYVLPICESRTETVLAAIGKSVLARSCIPWIQRTILVGYRDGHAHAGTALNLAMQLHHPIEHMTPEEFVERALAGEFGETPADAVRDDTPEAETE